MNYKHGIHIPHNAIHKALLSHGLANVNRNKSKRRKPWIRYEREHSLSLLHLDWHTSNHDGEKVYVCVVLDDSSRRILAGGEFDAETKESSLQLLKEAMDKFGATRRVRYPPQSYMGGGYFILVISNIGTITFKIPAA